MTIVSANRFNIPSTMKFPVFEAILSREKAPTIVMSAEMKFQKRVEQQ